MQSHTRPRYRQRETLTLLQSPNSFRGGRTLKRLRETRHLEEKREEETGRNGQKKPGFSLSKEISTKDWTQ